jgi:hypothetical protein
MPQARDAKGRFVGGAKKPAKRKRVRADAPAKRKRVQTNAPGVTIAVPAAGAKRSWREALKIWNTDRDEYAIPKKGTKEYREVQALRG